MSSERDGCVRGTTGYTGGTDVEPEIAPQLTPVAMTESRRAKPSSVEMQGHGMPYPYDIACEVIRADLNVAYVYSTRGTGSRKVSVP